MGARRRCFPSHPAIRSRSYPASCPIAAGWPKRWASHPDVDIHVPGEVEWAIATRFQADRDLVVVANAQGSRLDPSTRDGVGAKMGLDATAPPGAPPLKFKRISIPGEHELELSIASCLGWSLDLFDLFLLLDVAPVIGAAFFPSTHPTLSLAAVYAAFAVTVLIRPVGSAVFGSYADAHGRKGARAVAAVFAGLISLVFLGGSLIIPETRGRFE